ncbi:MAG: hypothetical protein NC548_64785, partial [Lachnospiraceae bacterium]|nr:hypothetical protein [Lachnospiraceae bacterium]
MKGESTTTKLVLNNLCPSISTNFTLPKGSYSLTINELSNAVVEVNGKCLNATLKDGKYTNVKSSVSIAAFEVGDKEGEYSTSISVVIRQIDGMSKWSVGKAEFAFSFNFKNAYDKLVADMAEINNYAYTENGPTFSSGNGLVDPADSRKAQVDALKTRYNNLIKTRNTLQTQITNVNYVRNNKETSDDAVFQRLISYYTEYNLAGDPNNIAADLDELYDDVENYVTDVNAENKVAATIKTNTDNYKKFTDKNGYFDEIAAALKNPHDGFKNDKVSNYEVSGNEKAYLEYIAANAKSNLTAAQTALKNAVTAAYSNLEDPNIDFQALENQYQSIMNQVKSYAGGYQIAIYDWESFQYFVAIPQQYVDVPTCLKNTVGFPYNLHKVQLISTKQFQKIDELGKKYNGIYTDIIDQYKAQLNDIYKNNQGYIINQAGGLTSNNPNIAGAWESYPDANQEMIDRINEMPQAYYNFYTFVNFQEGKYTDANNAINNATVGGSPVADVIAINGTSGFDALDEDIREVLGEYLDNLKSTYENWKKVTNTLYKAHELGVKTTANKFNREYNDAVDAFNKAKAEYETYVATNSTLQQTLNVIKKFESAQNYVSDKFEGLKYSDKLNSIFDKSYDQVDAWVEQYVDQVDVVAADNVEKTTKANALANAQIKKNIADSELTTAEADLLAAKTALAAAQVKVDETKLAYQNILLDTLATDAEKIAKRQAYEDALEALADAQGKVKEAQTAVETAEGNVETAKKELKDAQEASTKANNAYNTANTLLGDLLSSINNGCNTIRSNADQLYTAFSQPESALKTLEKSIENLQAEISKVENKQNIVTVTVDGVPAFNEKAPYVTVGVAVGNATKQWNVNDFVNKDAELDNILAQIAGGNTVKIGNTTYNCSNNTEFMNAATALNNALANNGTSYAISADEATLKLAKAVADANLAAIQNLYTVLTQSLSRLVDYKAPGA